MIQDEEHPGSSKRVTTMTDFEEYIRQGEPHKRDKAYAWKTAIGLQAVDGLETSDYLKDTARRNIEGDINMEEARELIQSYYRSKTNRTSKDNETEEADKVSVNIAKILGEQSFAFSIVGITSIHRRIFEGVFKFAGKIRDYDITKREWVLRGDTVLYVNSQDIRPALEYDLEQERNFSYTCLSMNEIINHIAKFVSGIWQIHPFGEGNTRTTAVFTIKYLRSIGFKADNELFADNSWYFRNALVRANYRNAAKGIEPDTGYLIKFFRNLLLGEQNILKNRDLIINAPSDRQENDKQSERFTPQVPHKYPTSTPQVTELMEMVGKNKLSVRQMMDLLHLKDRKNFLNTYLTPAIQEGIICLLYPDSPKHPRQKYLLTVKGLAMYNDMHEQ